MKRGRKTIADVLVLLPGSRQMPPAPPATLTPEQQKVWADALGSLPGDWLLPAAFPLMADYTRHVCRAQSLEVEISAFKSEWLLADGGVDRLNKLLLMAEREGRAALTAARQLRLTPGSTVRPGTAGRRVNDFRPGVVPWESGKTR